MNKITNLLKVKYPIIQGGMAWISDASLASAVSNAGGLGLIAAGGAPADIVRGEIRKCREMTDKPFGVNIMLMSPFAADIAEMVVEEKVPVVVTGAGTPTKFMPMWKEANITVIPVVAACAQARKMEKCGADAVVAEGCEAGGHIGEMTTMALVPQVVDSVQIPVIAAGGIADKRQVAAAFALGAVGVQVGTRFLVAHECTVHADYKAAVIGANDIGTQVTGRIVGHAARGIKNAFTRGIIALEKSGEDADKLEEMLTGSLKKAAKDGDVKNGSIMAGQVSGMIVKEQSCAEIIEEMFDGVDIG